MAGPDRLTELEIALTHQEALLEELNDVVRAQADALDLLRARVERLTARRIVASTSPFISAARR